MTTAASDGTTETTVGMTATTMIEIVMVAALNLDTHIPTHADTLTLDTRIHGAARTAFPSIMAIVMATMLDGKMREPTAVTIRHATVITAQRAVDTIRATARVTSIVIAIEKASGRDTATATMIMEREIVAAAGAFHGRSDRFQQRFVVNRP